MTHQVRINDRPQPTTRRSAARLLVAPVVGASVAAYLTTPPTTPGSAHATPTATTSPAYQLGYTKAVKDGRMTARRMRAEGFPRELFVVSSRIPKLCTKESASVPALPGLDGPGFMQGCADGMKSLVKEGIAA